MTRVSLRKSEFVRYNKKFEINLKRRLPLIHLPKATVDNVAVESINFQMADIRINAHITNRNVFDIKLKDYTYELSIENHEWIYGIIKGRTKLKAKESTAITIPINLSFKEVWKTLFDLLMKGKNVNYELHLALQMDADNNLLKGCNVKIKSKGTVKSLLHVLNGKSDNAYKN